MFCRGTSLAEVVIGAGIISLFLWSVVLFYGNAHFLNTEVMRLTQSAYLLEEGAEAIRQIRDFGWNDNIATLTAGTSYYLSFNGTRWVATTNNVMIDGVFERKFVVSNVNRDSNQDIAEIGSSDLDTKKVDISVSWLRQQSTTTQTLAVYLTNLFSEE